jgi:Na+/H+-dicarboxylate symporter
MKNRLRPAWHRPWPLYGRVLAGVAVGLALGIGFGARPIAFGVGTQSLSEVGLLVIRVLKTLATPLIFFAVLDALLRTRIPGGKGVALIGISLVNAIVAVAIGLGLAHLLHSGTGRFVGVFPAGAMSPASVGTTHVPLALPAAPGTPAPLPAPTLDPLKNLASYIPENLVDPFRSNSVIAVVLVSLVLGLALRATAESGGEEAKKGVQIVAAILHAGLQVCIRMLGWVVEVIPFAVAGVIAGVVGKNGLAVLGSLGAFVGTVVLGLVLHGFVYYSLVLALVARTSPLRFWRGAADAITTALSCGSSLATLPVTLRGLDAMKISPSSARLAACVGTNLNHDGIILYEAVATIFVAQALGAHLSFTGELGIALASVMAGIGIAGIPEAGLITLPLVLGAGGIPTAAAAVVIPLVLPVDWIIGRFRAATNVASDMTVATLLDRFFPASESRHPAVPDRDTLDA